MTDYSRMERHIRYNKIANAVRIVAIFAMAGEVYTAITYHFPLWDVIAMPVTLLVHQVASFIQKHTQMYRVDV